MKFKKIIFFFNISFFLLVSGCLEPKYDFSQTLPLKEIYKDQFLIGNIINPAYMSGNYFNLLKHHYNAITCENAMKPSELIGSTWNYSWSNADRMINTMIDNGMTIIGHTLLWHMQTPLWLTSGSNDTVRDNLVKYITDVATHFEGKIYSWDVVNEAFQYPFNISITNETDWRSGLRSTESVNWNKASTEEMNYIELAFRTARKADSKALLLYNDFDLNNPNKAKAVRNMIKEINGKWKAEQSVLDENYNGRNLIDGVGLQAHYGLSWWNQGNFSNVENNIKMFLELGIYVSITEMDIEFDNKNNKTVNENLQNQAVLYAQLFDLFVKLNNQYDNRILRVSMWGMDDKTSWKAAYNPCLFYGNLDPKPAFFAVSNREEYLK
jgi:endo-1,4-beta-xylanase